MAKTKVAKKEKKKTKEEVKPKTEEKRKEKTKPKKAEVKKEEINSYNPWKTLHNLSMSEKSMNMVEMNNTLVFLVDRKAKKAKIKEAVEKGFNVKVNDVNVVITMKGQKKAFVKLSPDHMAIDIASKLGML